MRLLILLLSLLPADDKEVEEALARFKAQYKNPLAAARAAAVVELGRSPHEKTLARLSSILAQEENSVRATAARAIGGFADYRKKATPLLLNVLGASLKNPEVAAAILEGLGKLDDETALPTIQRQFDQRDARVAKAAFEAVGAIRSAGSIEPILEALKKLEKMMTADVGGAGAGLPGGDDSSQKRAQEVYPAAIKAIQDITREPWTTAQEWGIWWNRSKATFKVAEAPAAAPPP